MLQLFHRFRGTILGVGVVLAAVLAISGFGVDLFGAFHRKADYAIKVDDHTVSYTEFYNERRLIEDQYRRMFGPEYYKLMQSLNLNLAQQVSDTMINGYLVERAAHDLGLRTSNEEVASQILALFPAGVQKAQYDSYLREVGMSAVAFEDKLRKDLLQRQFNQLLNDASLASRRESEAQLRLRDTKYDASYVEIDPGTLEKEIPNPADGQLQEYYGKISSELEVPPQVAYRYALIEQGKFLDAVPVLPDDVEFYYTEHLREYTEPELIRVRQLQFTLPDGASDADRAKLREKAESVAAKWRGGEPIEMLALQFSDDPSSKGSGGDLGWIGRGKMHADFDKAAFGMKVGEVSEIISTPTAFHVVKVEEKKEGRTKPLNEVRPEIEKKIREREAPAFILEKAHQLQDEWSKRSPAVSLVDFAKEKDIAIAATAGKLGAQEDPAANLKGLTAKVLETPLETRQIVELGDVPVLVEIMEYREAYIPSFGEAREKVLARWRVAQANERAKAIATELGSQTSQSKPLLQLAKERKLKAGEEKGLTKASAPQGVFAEPGLKDALFTLYVLGSVTPPQEAKGKWYVAQLTAVTTPASSELADKVADYRSEATSALGQTLVASYVATMKARATIDVAPGVLARE